MPKTLDFPVRILIDPPDKGRMFEVAGPSRHSKPIRTSMEILEVNGRKMTQVGMFYHESFSRRSYLTIGRRLADFPAALDALLQEDRFRLYRCPEISDELILKVHVPELIPEVEADPL